MVDSEEIVIHSWISHKQKKDSKFIVNYLFNLKEITVRKSVPGALKDKNLYC